MRHAPFVLALLVAFAAAEARADLPDWVGLELRRGAETTIDPGFLSVPPDRLARFAADQHPYVELLRRYVIDLEADGRMVERETLVRHLTSEAGFRGHGSIERTVRSEVERIIVEEAWVKLPDGRVLDFDPASLQIANDADPDLFSDVRRLIFAFGNLAPGATIVLVTRREMDRDEWPLAWSRIYLPQVLAPTEHFEVLVSWLPGQRAPRWASDDPKLHCRVLGGEIACRRHQVPPVPMDPDVQWGDRLGHLVVGADTGWRSLIDREREIVLAAAGSDAGVDELARFLQLRRGRPKERLNRIHRFVADQVRYVAFEHGDHAVVPRDAGETLALRYGDCKDKVALFLALARRAGLDAHPVLVATERYDVAKLLLPSWRYFDHMIACVGILQPVCVDLTDPYSHTGQLPLAVAGAVALQLRPGASHPINLSAGPYAWRIAIEIESEIDCDGALENRSDRHFRGIGVAGLRAGLAGSTAVERKRWIEQGYREIFGDQGELEVDLAGLDAIGQKLTLSTRARFASTGKPGSYTAWYESSDWLRHYGASLRTGNAHHPYQAPGARVSVSSTYRVCRDIRTRFMGADLDLRSKFGSLTRTYRRDGEHTVEVRSILDIPRQQVPVDQIQAFNRFLESALGQSNVWFSLEPSGGEGGGS